MDGWKDIQIGSKYIVIVWRMFIKLLIVGTQGEAIGWGRGVGWLWEREGFIFLFDIFRINRIV